MTKEKSVTDKQWREMHGWYNYKDNKSKVCFCIGPEKCNDESCPLVKQYKENNAKQS